MILLGNRKWIYNDLQWIHSGSCVFWRDPQLSGTPDKVKTGNHHNFCHKPGQWFKVRVRQRRGQRWMKIHINPYSHPKATNSEVDLLCLLTWCKCTTKQHAQNRHSGHDFHWYPISHQGKRVTDLSDTINAQHKSAKMDSVGCTRNKFA